MGEGVGWASRGERGRRELRVGDVLGNDQGKEW